MDLIRKGIKTRWFPLHTKQVEHFMGGHLGGFLMNWGFQSIPTHQADAVEEDPAGWDLDVRVSSVYPTSGSDLSKNDYNITLDFVLGGWK